MSKTIFILLLCFSSTVFGQRNTKFEAFVALFPKKTLPVCIRYAASEFRTEYYTPEDTSVKKDSIPYHDHVLPKDTALIINYELVKLFLLADTETVTPPYPGNYLPSDTIYPTYYRSKQLVTHKAFVCLMYERQFHIGNGNFCAEKYLCTLTKTGKLTDKMLVASANYSGTGILDGGFRVPWFPDVQSTINKDLFINFKDANNGHVRYRIDDHGNIKKVSR